MARQMLYFIIASILVVLLAKYLVIGLSWIQHLHHYILNLLGSVFAGGTVGALLRKGLALLLLPPLLLLLPALGYWLMNRKPLPHLQGILWGCWLVSATVILLSS
jgi:hypothetical protein